ncbi:MAG: hypothetical protein R3F59_03135 [Myxococcota bacterium]
MIALLSLTAAAAPGGHYVDAEFLALAEAGRAVDWHPNRWVSEVDLADGEARVALEDGPTVTCPTRSRGDTVVAACPAGDVPMRLRGDRLSAPVSWGSVTLRQSARTAQQILEDEARARTLRRLPQVAGDWRSGDARLTLDAAAAGRLRLAPCVDGEARTLCAHLDGDAFVLRDGQLQHAEVWPGDDGGETEYVRAVRTADAWVPDRPCARAICAVTWQGEGEPLRFVPTGDTVIESLWNTEALQGGVLRVEAPPGVTVTVRYRVETRGGVYVEDVLVPWGDLGVATPWQPLAGEATFTAPTGISALPAPLDRERILALTAAALPDDRADDTFRARAAAAVSNCASSSERPCVTGAGAVAFEIVAQRDGEAVDRVVLRLERGFGC